MSEEQMLCPACGAELRLPVGGECPVCLAELPQSVRAVVADQAVARAKANIQATQQVASQALKPATRGLPPPIVPARQPQRPASMVSAPRAIGSAPLYPPAPWVSPDTATPSAPTTVWNPLYAAPVRTVAHPPTPGSQARNVQGYAPGAINRAPITSGFAVTSFILGLLGICPYTAGVLPILAIIFGHIALGRINRSSATLGGRRWAIAGLVMGYLMVFGYVLFAIIAFDSAH
jgi:hypothetical protein